MKKRNRIILLLTVLAIIFSVGVIIITHARPSKSSEIKDLSNITLPSYSLPKGSLTKAKVMEDALKLSKIRLRHNQIPKNPQCVLITYGEYQKLFSPDFGLVGIPNDKLFYFVTVDVDRTLDERLRVPPPLARASERVKARYTTHQDWYLIDPKNGDVIGDGGDVVRWILPKQK